MTERLYYDNSYLKEFESVVTACRALDGAYEITLGQSAFYPTSGGQPYDTGTLRWNGGETPVSDVRVDPTGEVWHRINKALSVGTPVHGSIDWERRFDHMQQHGGEHMLAGALWRMLHGTTIGLHLGRETSSIDAELPDGRTHLTHAEMAALETEVNREIQEDAPVRCWFPDETELAALPLRKPPTVREHIRIVAFGDYEMVACGGTHPSSAGQIGLVKILSAAPAKGKVRVTFVCGMRAFRYLDDCQRAAEAGGVLLSCKVAELESAVIRLKEQNAALEKQLTKCHTDEYLKRMVDAEKDGLACLWLEAPEQGALTAAAGEYVRLGGKTLLCGGNGRLIFACSPEVERDMAALLRRAARGGGKKDFATGAGDERALEDAFRIITE